MISLAVSKHFFCVMLPYFWNVFSVTAVSIDSWTQALLLLQFSCSIFVTTFASFRFAQFDASNSKVKVVIIRCPLLPTCLIKTQNLPSWIQFLFLKPVIRGGFSEKSRIQLQRLATIFSMRESNVYIFYTCFVNIDLLFRPLKKDNDVHDMIYIISPFFHHNFMPPRRCHQVCFLGRIHVGTGCETNNDFLPILQKPILETKQERNTQQNNST